MAQANFVMDSEFVFSTQPPLFSVTMSSSPPNGQPNQVNAVSELFQLINTNSPDNYESEEKLIIALDFGTTFSGIAFCFPNQRDTKVTAILNWPGAEGESTPKIPTIINYEHRDKSKFAWGASVDRMNNSVVGVKLLLDPKQERPLYLPTGNIKRDIRKLPKPPVEIAADFIGRMYKHALKEIAKEVPSDYMSMCQKKFVLTGGYVPSQANSDWHTNLNFVKFLLFGLMKRRTQLYR